MIAVILAAGLGSRLKGLNGNLPKGFLQPEGLKTSLIERSIALLQKAGIQKIIIGTGFESKAYEILASKLNEQGYEIITCKNEQFQSTGSSHTLSCLKNMIDDDFLLLESDLLYESRALELLLNSKESDVILASTFTQSGDEVFLEIRNSRLYNLSKNPKQLDSLDAELVGISKISLTSFQNLEFENALDYEYLLKGFYVLIAKDLLWCEIDCLEHKIRAQKSIIPKLDDKDLTLPHPKIRNHNDTA